MSSKIKWDDELINRMIHLCELYSYRDVTYVLNDEFHLDLTPNAVRKAYERYKLPIIEKKENLKKPKILLFDIETMPMEFYVWSLWQDRLNLDMMKEDWSVLSFAAKWMGEDEVFYEDVEGQRNIRDDKKILKKIWKLLDEADFVVGHNSDSFDVKKLNARFILNGMKPPSSYKRLDTKKLAKKHFGFTSNKLSYLTSKLCKNNVKSSHNEFPGFSMWLGCINKNERAYSSMKEYNILDVTSLEELFLTLLPWENANLFQLYNEDNEDPSCTCGSKEFKKNGFYYTNSCKYQKYSCKKCGAEYRDSKNLIPKSKSIMRNTKR